MSKSKLIAVIALAALFGLPAAAHASGISATQAPISAIANLHTGDDDGQEDGEDGGHSESEDEGEEDDGFNGTTGDVDDSFVVPPVVGHIEDNIAGSGKEQIDPTERSEFVPLDGSPQISLSNAQVGEAIRVDRVLPSTKTPTDLFVDSALVGLAAIGSGAMVLGGVVGFRAVKARRSGEKFDYFYGGK